MSGWRYIAERLHGNGTATVLDTDLPLSDVSIEHSLSAHGGLTGLLRPMLLHRVLALLRPCRVFSRETVQNVVG